MKKNNVSTVIKKAYKKYHTKGETTRYMSWEYCYGFFNKNKSKFEKEDILDTAALHLAFYLASWGMYRGSSFLLQYDYKVHAGALKIMAENEYSRLQGLYKTDDVTVDIVSTMFKLVEKLKKYYKKQCGEKPTDTLITKILLGTFGCVPAYDRYVRQEIRKQTSESNNSLKASFNEKQFGFLVEWIKSKDKDESISNLKLIGNDGHGKFEYPLMKKIDMYFWESAPKKKKGREIRKRKGNA